MEAPHRPFGVNPTDLAAELEARRASHRAQVDLLNARLAEAARRAAQLRQRQSALAAERAALDEEVQQILAAFEQAGSELEARRQEAADRHGRELADRQAALAAVQHERDTWVALEQQIAEGVLAAVEPFLQLQAYLREREGGGT